MLSIDSNKLIKIKFFDIVYLTILKFLTENIKLNNETMFILIHFK